MEYLSSGSFTKVYKKGDYVYGKTTDILKLVLFVHNFYKFPKLLPSENKRYQYKCKYYPLIYTGDNHDEFYDSLKEDDQYLFDELREMRREIVYRGVHFLDALESYVSSDKAKKSLKKVWNLISNTYGIKIKLDGLENNIACDKKGNLVFLDIFFCPNTLQE